MLIHKEIRMDSPTKPLLPVYGLRSLIALQIALAHAAAGGVVALILWQHETLPARVVFAVLAAALTGVVLTLNVQQTLAALYLALMRLNAGLSMPPLRTPRIDPLSPLITQINTLAGRDVSNLRDALLAQTREAAIQEERNRLA